MLTSTPTVKGHSRIEKAYNESTKEQWCLPCPSCGELQTLEWRRVNFETLQHACSECEAPHSRDEWLAGEGQWIARNPDCLTRGFHFNALVSPFVRWETLVDEFRQAMQLSNFGDHTQLITFVNTVLGETWEDRGEQVDDVGLLARREIYYADVPEGVAIVTIGVDTQDNRLCYSVFGWGAGRECWALEYGELWSDPRVPGSLVWGMLDEVIQKPRAYHNGRLARVFCTTIDMGGHASDQVCAYAKARQGWNVWAVRGEGGQGKAFVKSWSTYKKSNATVFTLGVDTGKDEMAAMLRVKEPGPGYVHFPKGEQGECVKGFDERYFQGLTSEKKISVPVRGNFRKYIWELMPGRQNEPLDTMNYALAALAILKPDLDKIAELAPWALPPKPEKMPSPLPPIRTAAGPAKKRPLNGGLNRGKINSFTAV